MQKILHISKYYPPHRGGIEDVCFNIVSELKEQYQQTVICFNDSENSERDLFDNVQVFRVGTFFKVASQSFSFSYFPILKKIIAQFNPDIVHFHAPNPLISLYLLLTIHSKTKLIVHWHSDIVEQKELYFFYKTIEKKLLKRADGVIATSDNYCKYSQVLTQYLSKIVVIPNMITEEKLILKEKDSCILQILKGKYEGQKLILFIGRLVPYKGLDYLIDAAAELTGQYKIIVIGGGPQEEILKQKSRDVPNICFLGKISDQYLRIYLHLSNVFVFPSITKNEAFGVALAEALYCGLPAVCFDIKGSGVSWVNQDGLTGFVVKNRDSAKLAEAINKLLEDDKLRKKMGQNAIEWAKSNFLRKTAVNKIVNLYNSLF